MITIGNMTLCDSYCNILFWQFELCSEAILDFYSVVLHKNEFHSQITTGYHFLFRY